MTEDEFAEYNKIGLDSMIKEEHYRNRFLYFSCAMSLCSVVISLIALIISILK